MIPNRAAADSEDAELRAADAQWQENYAEIIVHSRVCVLYINE